jgi:antitoxin ParD1/3/4
MRTTAQLSITLPKALASAVKARVTSGQYASESEVIRDGLRALLERERAIEHWLQAEVVPTMEALQADRTQALSVREARQAIAAQPERRTRSKRAT